MNQVAEKATSILYLSGKTVQTICDDLDTIRLIREVFSAHGTGEMVLPSEAYLGWKNYRNDAVRSLSMPGYLGGKFQVAGTKIINSNPANPAHGLPRASGLTALFDPETARIQCIMEGSYISALRTASVSILSVNLLGCGVVRSLCMIGTGPIGVAHLKLALKTLPALERVILFDLNSSAAEEAARVLSCIAGEKTRIEVAENCERAVKSAEVVITATTVVHGYIPYAWLKPGTVAINVSLDDFLPEVFLKADLLFVDDWKLIEEDSRRILGRLHRDRLIAGPGLAEAHSTARKVSGELSDLVLGRHKGRRSSDEIILVNPFGLAIEDIGFASCVFEIAQRRGLGTYLDI